MMLSSKQFDILQIAKAQGYVTVQDSRFIYSSTSARINALKTLVGMGYLKISVVPNRFELTQKGVEAKL